MPLMDGIEATEHIRACCRLTRALMLTAYDDPEYVQRALEVGAKGYVLKDAAGEELLEAIRIIQRGSHYFSEKIAKIAKNYLAHQKNDSSMV